MTTNELPPPTMADRPVDPNTSNTPIVMLFLGIFIPFLALIGMIMGVVQWQKSRNLGYRNPSAFAAMMIGIVLFTLAICGAILLAAVDA